jgi:hypothetical protein
VVAVLAGVAVLTEVAALAGAAALPGVPYAGSKDAAVANTLDIGAGVNAITTLGEEA